MKPLPTYSQTNKRSWKRSFKAIGKKESIRILAPLVYDYLRIFSKSNNLSEPYLANVPHFYGTIAELSSGQPREHCEALRIIIQNCSNYHFTVFACARPAFDLLMINDTPHKFERHAMFILSFASGCELDLSRIQQEVSKLISDF